MRKVMSLAIVLAFFLFAASAQAAPPVNTGPPSISGIKRIFEPLTLNRGTWENMSGGTYFQQWQRRVSGQWRDIPYALGTSLIPGHRDVGRYIRAQVIAYNGDGSAEVFTPAYFIKGSGVNGVEIFPGANNPVRMKSNGVVRMGRVLCNEGYCKIKRVRVRLRIAGVTYRAKARFQRREIGPGRMARIKVIIPGYLRGSLPGEIRMRVRAFSSNSDVEARVMRRIVSY